MTIPIDEAIRVRVEVRLIIEATCGRCGHLWELKRTDADGKPLIPKKCPSCKSPYWNKPRKYRKAAGEESGEADTMLLPLDGQAELDEAEAVEAPTEQPQDRIADLMNKLKARNAAN